MAAYTVSDILERPAPYKILREAHLSDGGTYSAQVDLKSGIDEEIAEKIINELVDSGILYPLENTDPQLYEVNYTSFEEIWTDLWKKEVGFEPDTPVHFETFLEHYVKSYLNSEDTSNIREMLVGEFFLGLNSQFERGIPSNYEELLHRLSKEFEGKRKTRQHIDNGLNYVE